MFERKGGANMSNWHSMEINQVSRELDTNPHLGLSDEEVRSRLEKYGYNELKREEQRQPSFWSPKNILTIILINAAVLSVLVPLLFPSIPARLKSWLYIIVEAM
jgi:magnesium-transporting ATPase (P-type)